MKKEVSNLIEIEVNEYEVPLPQDIHLAGGDIEILICLKRVDDEKSYGILLSIMEYDSARMEGRHGLFPLESRGKRKKKHAEIRKTLGVSKREYCRIMGALGGLLSPYLHQ